MVEYRRIIINNYTEEECESNIFNAVLDLMWYRQIEGVISRKMCGSTGLYCVAKIGPKEIEIDVYDYEDAPPYTN
jgi:hypothetical protein